MSDQPSPIPPPAEEVILTYRRETFTVRPGLTLRQAILRCGLNPETTLAVLEGQLVTGEVVLRAGDRVRLVATISGG